LTPEAARALILLAHVGVQEVILRGYDDPATWFRKCSYELSRASGPLPIMEYMAARLPTAVLPFVEYCLLHAEDPPSVASAASALGVHRRTLVHRLSMAGFPTPRLVLSWCRLFVALDHVERLNRSVEDIAHTLHFGSRAALRRMCMRYTGLTLAELRRRGAVQTAVRMFCGRVARPVATEASTLNAARPLPIQSSASHPGLAAER
jgi:AraC-like DNA-binding protein